MLKASHEPMNLLWSVRQALEDEQLVVAAERALSPVGPKAGQSGPLAGISPAPALPLAPKPSASPAPSPASRKEALGADWAKPGVGKADTPPIPRNIDTYRSPIQRNGLVCNEYKIVKASGTKSKHNDYLMLTLEKVESNCCEICIARFKMRFVVKQEGKWGAALARFCNRAGLRGGFSDTDEFIGRHICFEDAPSLRYYQKLPDLDLLLYSAEDMEA